MSAAELKAAYEAALAENAQLKAIAAARAPKKTLKVSEKGAVSLYGLGRFPVTFYKEQWIKILDMADEIRAFIKANDSKLRAKGDAAPTQAAA